MHLLIHYTVLRIPATSFRDRKPLRSLSQRLRNTWCMKRTDGNKSRGLVSAGSRDARVDQGGAACLPDNTPCQARIHPVARASKAPPVLTHSKEVPCCTHLPSTHSHCRSASFPTLSEHEYSVAVPVYLSVPTCAQPLPSKSAKVACLNYSVAVGPKIVHSSPTTAVFSKACEAMSKKRARRAWYDTDPQANTSSNILSPRSPRSNWRTATLYSWTNR